MSLLVTALRRGTRAAQPAAAAVGEGTLYYVTDEELTEQQIGGAWVAYSYDPSVGGSGTVTNTGTLTDHGVIVGNGGVDVSAIAVGTNNQLLAGNTGADPSFRQAVEADLNLTDVTTANASASAHGFLPKLSNIADEFLNGTGGWSTVTSTPPSLKVLQAERFI